MVASPGRVPPGTDAPFRACIRIALPPEGLGSQLAAMMAWLDANCGMGKWEMTRAGLRGVVNDALAIYFVDAAVAKTFVARWCMGYRVEPARARSRTRPARF